MKPGDLCKVIRNDSHVVSQKGHLVIIVKGQFKHEYSSWVEGLNLTTFQFHHYSRSELEVVNE